MLGSEQDTVPALSQPIDDKDNDNKSSYWLSANYILSSLHKLARSILKTPTPILQMKKLRFNRIKQLA